MYHVCLPATSSVHAGGIQMMMLAMVVLAMVVMAMVAVFQAVRLLLPI